MPDDQHADDQHADDRGADDRGADDRRDGTRPADEGPTDDAPTDQTPTDQAPREHEPDDSSPSDVFGLLADDSRIEILEALARAQHEREGVNAGPAALRFSEIYDRVDVDGTSKLSYHLGELTGVFVRKSEAGYGFTHAGERLVRFVLSGNYRDPRAFDPVDVDGTCIHCGGEALEATLDEQFFLVRCRDCARPVNAYHVSPAQVRDASGMALIERIVDRQTAEIDLARRGICPDCAGPLATEVRTIPEELGMDAVEFYAVEECSACLRRVSNPLPLRLAYHPASVAFHWEAGIDVTERGVWELAEHLRAGRWDAERTATDPDEYVVHYRRDDATLRLHLDAEAAVTGTERVRRTDVDGDGH